MDQDTITAIAATATALRIGLTNRGAGRGEAFSWVTAAMPAIVAYETGVIRYAETETRNATANTPSFANDGWTVLREPPADEPGQLWDIGRHDPRDGLTVTARGASHARLCSELSMTGPGARIYRRHVPEEDVNRRQQS